jgi:prefoldin subunit 5
MRAEPLGGLLVSRGHLTEEQLELALTEQKATGRPLGEIVVARGFTPAPTVAQALATQHGGLLKTEYGFATGWGGGVSPEVEATGAPPAHDATASLRASLDEHKQALAAWQQSHKDLQEQLAQVKQAEPGDDSRVAELEADRERLQAELDARDASIEQLEQSAASVESRRAELEEALAKEVERGAALRADLEAAGASDTVRAELEERLSGIEAESGDRLQAAVAELESLRWKLETELSAARERTAELEAEVAARDADLDALRAVPAGRWDAAGSHLVFFQGVEGYELHERSGPPPSEGSQVGTQIVARIARAPFPGSPLPCAYLVA